MAVHYFVLKKRMTEGNDRRENMVKKWEKFRSHAWEIIFLLTQMKLQLGIFGAFGNILQTPRKGKHEGFYREFPEYISSDIMHCLRDVSSAQPGEHSSHFHFCMVVYINYY